MSKDAMPPGIMLSSAQETAFTKPNTGRTIVKQPCYVLHCKAPAVRGSP